MLNKERRLRTALVAIIALAAGLVAHFVLHRPIVNDEAVELLQGTGMPLNSFHFFTPESAYPDSGVEPIESAIPYLNGWLAKIVPPTNSVTGYMTAIRAYYLAGLILACLLFSTAVRNLFGTPWDLAAGIAMACSSFVLITNGVITRNGLSILWASAALLALQPRKTQKAWPNIGAVALPLMLLMGCWTYTSMRILAASLYFAIGVHWLLRNRTKWEAVKIAGSMAAFLLLLILLVVADGTSLAAFLDRGSYATGNWAQYPHRLLLALMSPWYYTHDGTVFVVEDVHLLVGHPILSPLLWPFFAIGWITAWIRTERTLFVAMIAWTTGMAACAIAGPNVKYLVVFFPLTLLLSLSGIQYCTRFFEKRFHQTSKVCMGSLTGLAIGWEFYKLLVNLPTTTPNHSNNNSIQLARTAEQHIRKGNPWICVFPGVGGDIVTWYLRPYRSPSLFICKNRERFLEILAKYPPPAEAVLIADIPSTEKAEYQTYFPNNDTAVISTQEQVSNPPTF